MTEATSVLDAVYRALAWAGYTGLGGALAVLLVLWPEGVRQRRLALVAIAGSTLTALATSVWLGAHLLLGDLPRVEGAAAILRLAVLAAVGGFLTDLLDAPVRGRRRTAAFVAALALTGTMLAGAAGGRPAEGAPVFTGDVFVAITALVLGVCLVLACVVLPGDAAHDVPHLRVRVVRSGPAALGAVALAGAVHAIAAARSPWGFPGAVAVLDALLLVVTAAAVLGVHRVLRRADGGAATAAATVPAVATATTETVVRPWFEPVDVDRRPAVALYEGPRPVPDDELRADVPDEPAPAQVVVLPDTDAARAQDPVPHEEVRRRRRAGAGRARRSRYLAGVGRLVLPDPTEPATRTDPGRG